MSENAIGVFDSGVGGLTVLHELRRLLPGENLVYLGDTARVPYGTKSPETVRKYALQAAEFLIAQRVKMVVVACNTASSFALQLLQQQLSVPVVGVIAPGADRAVRLTAHGVVGVIGTDGTVHSDAYPRALKALQPQVSVVSVACPLFVPLAEEGWAEHEIARLAAEEYLAPLVAAGIDTLVLGCTHYPLLKPTLKAVLPPSIKLVDSAEETALVVQQLLTDRGELNAQQNGCWQFYVTDVPTRFVRVGSGFLGQPVEPVERISLPACPTCSQESPQGRLS
ncbi:MAG: glutamate racemase [Desulfuromonas sp.]|nr:glutamate racemase [Desulfuromonas sp.]